MRFADDAVSSPAVVGATLVALLEHPIAGPPTAAGLTPTAAGLKYLDGQFGRRARPGIRMAARALQAGIPEERAEAVCLAYTAALRGVVGSRRSKD